MRLGRGEGSKSMSAPSLADPNSVLRRTPISMTRVEKRSPTTTATAIIMMTLLTRAALRFLRIRADAFTKGHPSFSRCKIKGAMATNALGVFHRYESKAALCGQCFATYNRQNAEGDPP